MRPQIPNRYAITMVALGCACLWLTSLPAAERSNQQTQEIFKITANQTFYDHKTGQMVYQGAVQATLGKRMITASNMTVRLDKHSRPQTITASDQAVKFYDSTPQQTPVYAQGSQLTYRPDSKLIKLVGQAYIKLGTQEIHAHEINYHLTTHKLYLRGNPNKPISMTIEL